MDWWEKQQLQVDLNKIRHMKKKKKARTRQETLVLADVAAAAAKETRKGAAEVVVAHEDGRKVVRQIDYNLEGEASRGGRGLSQLDVGVCVVFYVVCAAIIIVLYYHFIVQKRFRVPCANFLPV